MGKFNDFLDKFGDADLPEGFLTSAMTAYDEDMSIPVAKVAAVEKERDEAAAKVAELKVLNFDLIRNGLGAGATPTGNVPGNDPVEDAVGETVTIDDLFD